MDVKKGNKGYKVLLEFEKKKGSLKEGEIKFFHEKKEVKVGLGKKDKFKPKSLIKIFYNIFKEVDEAHIELKDIPGLYEFPIYGAYLADWEFGFKKEKEDKKKKILYYPDYKDHKDEIEVSKILAEAQLFAREIASTPSNIATPEWMVKKARELKKLGLEIKVLNKNDMRKLGMELFLAVNQGSNHDPYLVQITYKGGKDEIAFLGKGLCFDTGGLSIKPARYMYQMHMDKSGAAVVLGIMKAIAQLKPKITVHGFLALTENSVDAKSIQPGAVVKALDGTYVEIVHTDAEGRLVLGDSLAYIYKKLKPKYVIDLATLTGAANIITGRFASPIMGNNQDLVNEIINMAEKEQEYVWPLPLWDEYKTLLKSSIADIKNIGGWDGEASTITAAKFLEHFVKKENWAHIDIASTMDDKELHQGLAQAPMVRTLVKWVLSKG